MKLAYAREIGKECGLDTDAECIANIEIHCMSLFDYTKLEAELKELRDDCMSNGIDYDKIMDDYNKRFNEALSKIK